MATTRDEKAILGVTSAAHFMTHLFELAFPALALTVRDDLGWSLAEVLQLSFLMYLLFGLGALPMGLLADHWKARWVLGGCMVGAGVGALLASLSTSRLEFAASLGLVGLSISAYHPAGMSLISRTLRERGRALGINGVFGNLGSAAAPFVAGVLAFELGWRAAYAWLGVVGLLVGFATWLVPVRETEVPEAGDPVAGRTSARAGGFRWGWFALLCMAMMFAGLSYRGVSLVLPATFRDHAVFLGDLLSRLGERGSGVPVENLAATLLASGVYAAGMLGQVVGGHLADRHDLRRLYLGFHAASLPFLVAMAFTHEGLLVVSAALYIFFSLGMQPIENSLVARFTPARWRSTSYGIKFILNFGVGSLAVRFIGALRPDGEYTVVYLSLAGAVAMVVTWTAVLLWVSRRTPVTNTAPVTLAS